MRWILLVVLIAGCSAGTQPVSVAPPAAAEFAHLEERALLLLLVDQQLYDSFTVSKARQLGSEMRVELARSLARAGDFRGREDLEALVIDDDLEVRREAVFGLGVLGDAEAIIVLGRATRAVDSETGWLAVEAMAKLGAPLTTVLDVLEGLPAEEYWSRLTPALYRFPVDEALPTVRRALIEGGSANYAHAMYALARNPHQDSRPVLRDLLADPDPMLRALAARALGQIGDGSDLARLWPLLEAIEPSPVIQALRSARQLVTRGAAAPPSVWNERLLELMDDPRGGVRSSALETAGGWAREPEIGRALLARATVAQGRERELALLALAGGQHPRAAELVGAASQSESRSLRQRAAAAAGLTSDTAVLGRLAEDVEPAVRAAAIGEMLRLEGEADSRWIESALADPDPVVRATGFEWAQEHPRVPVADLVTALGGMGATDVVEAQLAALAALEARAAAIDEERPAVVAALALLADGANFVLRRRAGDSLVALGESRPPVGGVSTKRNIGVYRDLLRQAWPPRAVRLVTSSGTIEIALECRLAPLTCVNFLQLVQHGFFDGVSLHRVVPDFVIQGGDPRGDGYGGPGYMIRDEINRLRYGRGMVGMALAGADTGGSQFFITLSPQPHLDGNYTIFGQVVAGDDLLDGVAQGDLILSAEEIAVPLG